MKLYEEDWNYFASLYPPSSLYFNNYVDELYCGKYLILESNGVSKLLINVLYKIFNLIKPYILQKKECFIYTGYNWSFNDGNFVKVDDPDEEYPLYIILKASLPNNKHGQTRKRNFENEKNGDTRIIIWLSLNYNEHDILGTLIHELLHCRVIYAKRDIDVYDLDSTNVYSDQKIKNEFTTLFNRILYMMSNGELSAHIQLIYQYVLKHPNIKDIDIDDKELLKIVGLDEFYAAYNYLANYSDDILYILYLYEMFLNFGLTLKQKFNYKNQTLTQLYINNVVSGDIKYNGFIFSSIMDFIYSKIQLYLRKVARTIYFAIDKRDKKYLKETIHTKVNKNKKNQFIKKNV